MFVQHQELYGMLRHQLANAQQDFMDSIVNNVQLQDSGIQNKTLVSAQLQEQSGTQPTNHVIAHQDCLVHNV